ncbi:MAG: hypothetical protein ABSB78_11555 [Bacteroidota bacterium]
MKRLLVVFFLCTTISCAQNSVIPTAFDLQNLFRKIISGKAELMETLTTICQKGDTVLPSFQTLLNTPPLKSNNGIAIMRQRRGWYFSAMALEQIGSVNSYAILQSLAQSHPDKEVRGFAINSLAESYYSKCISDSTQPDRTILHILVLSIDDTTYLTTKENTIGTIARDGLMRWTGFDFGEDVRKVPGIRGTIIQVPAELRKDRELWWQTVGIKLIWNATDGQFE